MPLVDFTQQITDLYGEPIAWGGDVNKVHRSAVGACRMVKAGEINATQAIAALTAVVVDEPLTLDRACVIALQGEIEGDDRKAHLEIIKRTDLAREIVAAAKSGMPLKMDAERIKMIKDRVFKVHPPVIADPVWRMVEPPEPEERVKPELVETAQSEAAPRARTT